MLEGIPRKTSNIREFRVSNNLLEESDPTEFNKDLNDFFVAAGWNRTAVLGVIAQQGLAER